MGPEQKRVVCAADPEQRRHWGWSLPSGRVATLERPRCSSRGWLSLGLTAALAQCQRVPKVARSSGRPVRSRDNCCTAWSHIFWGYEKLQDRLVKFQEAKTF